MESHCLADEKQLSHHDNDILDRLFNPNLPSSDISDGLVKDDEVASTPELEEAKRLESEGVKAAEAGDVIRALDHFNQAIAKQPDYASGYNNRAQALRLVNDTNGALDDLNKAIELSGGHGRAACQAYTQRGLLFKLQEKEDDALEDFKKAAKLGGAFAKQMVVSLNPYAALCNQMLAEVMTKLQKGEAQG